jgi:hypothetical protein
MTLATAVRLKSESDENRRRRHNVKIQKEKRTFQFQVPTIQSECARQDNLSVFWIQVTRKSGNSELFAYWFFHSDIMDEEHHLIKQILC